MDGASFPLNGCPAGTPDASFNSTEKPPIPRIYPANPKDDKVEAKIECCGKCFFRSPHLQVYYFPDPNAESYCGANGRKVGFVGDPISSITLPGFTTASGNLSTARVTSMVVDGHTM